MENQSVLRDISKRSLFDAKDKMFMRRALALAKRGLGVSSPNPTVGCVVVRDGDIVGEGYHAYETLDHAEVHALRQAGDRARNATVYLTLEPCTHQGRTPPCLGRLLDAGIGRAVIAASDPNPSVCGFGIEGLRAAGVQVDFGLMGSKSEELIEPFACHISRGIPLVVSKAGLTLDGHIAARKKSPCWISCDEARSFGQSLRHRLDAILAGVGTILADDPMLTYRGSLAKRRPLLRVILDSRLRTPPSARLFSVRPETAVLIFCSARASVRRRMSLESRGAEVISIPRGAAGLELSAVLEELGRRGVLGMLVEGGSSVHWSFLSAGLVDKFYFIFAPLVLGGRDAVPVIGGRGYPTIRDAAHFLLRNHFRVGSDVVLEAFPSGSKSILSPWRSSKKLPSGGRYSVRS